MPVVILRTPASKYASVGGGGGSAFPGFTPNTNWTATDINGDQSVMRLRYSPAGLSIPTDPRPDFWLPCQNSIAKDATYSKSTSPTLVLQTNASFQTTIKPPGSTHALNQLFLRANGSQPGSGGPTDPGANFFDDSGGTANPFTVSNGKYYMNFDGYKDFDCNDVNPGHEGINGKMIRAWDLPPGSGTQDWYITEGFVRSCNLEGTSTDFKNGVDPHYSGISPQNSWYKQEFISKESSINAYDGFLDACRNGNWAYGDTNRAFGSRPTDAQNLKTYGFLSQYSPGAAIPADAHTPPNNANEYFANWYCNSSGLFRVVLSNESTYQNTNQGTTDPAIYREPQLPLSASGSSSGVDIFRRLGRHASYSGKKVILIDDNDVRYICGTYS